jgi:hypothetical protein
MLKTWLFVRDLVTCVTTECVSDFVETIWDPLSTSQTRSLTVHCRVAFEQFASENEVSKNKQVMISADLGFSSMTECLPSMQETRVQFPVPQK